MNKKYIRNPKKREDQNARSNVQKQLQDDEKVISVQLKRSDGG